MTRKTIEDALSEIDANVHPIACDRETALTHMRAFIDAFVLRDRKERCRFHLTRDQRKFFRELPRCLSDRCCWRNGEERFQRAVGSLTETSLGVYWAEHGEPVRVTGDEAFALHPRSPLDAVFSLHPGRTALLFDHHEEVAACLRTGGRRTESRH